jgi:hypothetical protein
MADASPSTERGGAGSEARPPNHVPSQAEQLPGIRNGAFGRAAMPMRGRS